MERIGIICEYNPFHNGHMYHLEKIKEMFPDSIIILVLNGYFLERGEVSILTKEEKTKLALLHGIDIVLELPVLFGTQSADHFAEASLTILNHFKINKFIFGSELNNVCVLKEIVNKITSPIYQEEVKKLLKTGLNYPTALSKAIRTDVDFNHPNDLLAISYLKTIEEKKFAITPISIKRTSNYHDLESNNKIISASNIRNKYKQKENIDTYLPKESKQALLTFNETLYFQLLKTKILTTPHLEQFLTVDEGIEKRLQKGMEKSVNLEEFIKNVKTKRYTYNKINRMCIHILLGIRKIEKNNTLSYIKILGFSKKGKEYLNSINEKLTISTKVDKNSLQYQRELKASQIFDILNNTNTHFFELQNKPITKM